MTYPLHFSAAVPARHAMAAAWDEASLIVAAQAGCPEAFNQLALAYQDRLYSTAYYILGDAASASDATQEALIAAYRHLRSFRRGSSLKKWLYRIVTRKCYDTFRETHRRRSTSLDEFGEADIALHSREDGPEQVVQRRELARRLEASLGRLALAERQIVVLCDVDGMSYLEIAKVTGVPVGTVKSRLSRARAKLRGELGTGVEAAGPLT